jgi:hypothetical protein
MQNHHLGSYLANKGPFWVWEGADLMSSDDTAKVYLSVNLINCTTPDSVDMIFDPSPLPEQQDVKSKQRAHGEGDSSSDKTDRRHRLLAGFKIRKVKVM